jgi:hypothetical protein
MKPTTCHHIEHHVMSRRGSVAAMEQRAAYLVLAVGDAKVAQAHRPEEAVRPATT